MKKYLVLLRHGQTLFNATGRIQGWCDSPLTQTGMEQAEHAGNELKRRNLSFTAAYSSPSERCTATLEIACPMPFTLKKGLKEMNFGIYEGQPEYLQPPFPAFLTFFESAGGESTAQTGKRVAACLDEIMEEDSSQSVLAVSHAGAILNFLENKQLMPPSGIFKLPNAALVFLEFEDGEYRLKEIFDPMNKEKVYEAV